MEMREAAINRMLRILQRFYHRLTIAIHLPLLLKREDFIEKFKRCNAVQYKALCELCTEANWKNDRCSDKMLEGGSTSDHHYELAVVPLSELERESQWAVILEVMSQFELEILRMIEGMSDDDVAADESDKHLIRYAEELRDIVDWQMRKTPKELRERKVELRNAESRITSSQQQIGDLEETFNEETLKHNEIVESAKLEIDELEIVIERIAEKHRTRLDHEMEHYKSAVLTIQDDLAEQVSSLSNQVDSHNAMLDELIQANMAQEVLLREQCVSKESENLTARNNYDRDLTKLNELKETLENQLSVMNNHCEVVKNEYEVQTVLFTNLKKERELTLMQQFAEKLESFEKNRAARIIQRNWRAHHERVVAAKKKKKRSRRNR